MDFEIPSAKNERRDSGVQDRRMATERRRRESGNGNFNLDTTDGFIGAIRAAIQYAEKTGNEDVLDALFDKFPEPKNPLSKPLSSGLKMIDMGQGMNFFAYYGSKEKQKKVRTKPLVEWQSAVS